MKIERINENQIKCTLNRSDLASRHLKLGELAYGTEKAKDLFQDMMEQASLEFGFEANDIPLMIEAIPVSMDCIILMITKVDENEEGSTKLSGVSAISGIKELLEEHLNTLIESKPAKEAAPSKKEKPSEQHLFSFDSLEVVISLAHTISILYSGTNSLYKCKKDGRYYLLLNRGENGSNTYTRVLISASEYGKHEKLTYASAAYMEEHFEKIIDGNALQSLAYV